MLHVYPTTTPLHLLLTNLDPRKPTVYRKDIISPTPCTHTDTPVMGIKKKKRERKPTNNDTVLSSEARKTFLA